MGRIVAIGGGDLQSNLPINRYIVGMDKKERHNLLFVGTASKDAEGYIDSIKTAFEQLDTCQINGIDLTWSIAKTLLHNFFMNIIVTK